MTILEKWPICKFKAQVPWCIYCFLPPSPGRSLLSYPSSSLSRIRVKMVILSLLSSGNGSLWPTTALQEPQQKQDIENVAQTRIYCYPKAVVAGWSGNLSLLKQYNAAFCFKSSFCAETKDDNAPNAAWLCKKPLFFLPLTFQVNDHPQAIINIWITPFGCVCFLILKPLWDETSTFINTLWNLL